MSVRSVQEPKKKAEQPQANVHWLYGYVKKHRTAAILSIIFGMGEGIISSMEPYLIGVIIDHVREGVSINQIAQDALLMFGLALLAVISFAGVRYFSGKVAYESNFDIRRDLFDNMLTLQQSFYQHYPTGDLISRMHSDVEMMWRILALSLTRGGGAVFTLLFTFVLLASVNPLLALGVFIILSISTMFQMRAGKVLTPVFEQVQDQGGVISALVQDSISGIQTIKTTGAEAGVAQKFSEENQEYRRIWLFFRRRNEPVGLLPNMISELAAATVVTVGGYMTIKGYMTIGNFAQFLIYLGLISRALLHIGMIYQRYQQTRGAFLRLTPLMQHATIQSRKKPRSMPQNHIRGDIEFDNISLKLDGTWILQDISLKIPAGTTVALVGATGCGKTMLVNLLARVLDPTEGRVLVDGVDIRDIDLEQLRDTYAYVPQSTFLFSQPIEHNIHMGQELENSALEEAVNISRVSNDLEQLPEGLETMVGERGVMLSGGQKQRVAIARAIIRDPAVLILDDALSSVDTHTAADILADLRKVLRTRTSIIIAHRIATVKDADHIIVMDEGQVVEQGTHDELIRKRGFYMRMVEREIKLEDVH